MHPSDRALHDRIEAALDSIDLTRLRVSETLDPDRRVTFGQFMTPITVARSLAEMFSPAEGKVRIADPGAGIGSLGAAVTARLLGQNTLPAAIELTAWEIDDVMAPGLERTMDVLAELCATVGVDFVADVRRLDFLADGANQLTADLLAVPEEFDLIVMNPPYRKIHSGSQERKLCHMIGLETTNLYTAFLAVGSDLVRPTGELVAIVPRSFANGTYFTPFRRRFTSAMTFMNIHVYESRSKAFADDAVLQENVIFRAVKSRQLPETVKVTAGYGPDDNDPSYREVPYDEVIRPGDDKRVIHIVPDENSKRIAERISSLPCSLEDLGIAVSTGRVVDFRATEFLRKEADEETVPLIYPGHLRDGRVVWPVLGGKKPNGLLNVPGAADLMVPEGLYVLTKRFSSKEERRRIVASMYDPADVSHGPVGFENHLNYYHAKGCGLDRPLSIGLLAFLNSTLVDLYFRQFSGHTQVNAGDLRNLCYPSLEQLRRLGELIGGKHLVQRELDRLIDEELYAADRAPDPVLVHERVNESIEALRRLGFPKSEVNERSGLALLAFLGLGPADEWAQSSNPIIEMNSLMEFIKKNYGKKYSPNTCDAMRGHTVNQFVNAGLVIRNPGDVGRDSSALGTSYQISRDVLGMLRKNGTRYLGLCGT